MRIVTQLLFDSALTELFASFGAAFVLELLFVIWNTTFSRIHSFRSVSTVNCNNVKSYHSRVKPNKRHGVSDSRPPENMFMLAKVEFPITAPLQAKSSSDQWIPLTEGRYFGMRLHIMTSLWTRVVIIVAYDQFYQIVKNIVE